MLVKLSFSGYVDTERQDKYLKKAIENCVLSQSTIEEVDLVKRTFLSRFDDRFLTIEPIVLKENPNIRFIDTLNPF